jgi:hypothetical protein
MLPQSIRDRAEFSPVEDVVVPLMRDAFPELHVGGEETNVQSLIEHDQTFPFILIRRSDSFGQFSGDHRFVDSAQVVVHTFCEDPDGDQDAALLADAVRVALRDAWLQHKVVPGRGHITGFDVLSVPHRVTDWATATGPVQYADLPTGVHRYEARYELSIRRPRRLVL